MRKNPCYNCVRRCYLCHEHCDEYADWVKERREYNEKVHALREHRHMVEGFLCDQKKRVRAKNQLEWNRKYRETHRKG